MSDFNTYRRSEPCVWISAGLLDYKLCDRDFDCQHCPLDAALQGYPANDTLRAALVSPGEVAELFPDDRLYTSGHSWVQATGASGGRLLSFGLDALAATLIGRCSRVCCSVTGTRAPGEFLCEIDLGLGELSIAAPVMTSAVTPNEKLGRDPNRLVVAPYGDGWIAELTAVDLVPLSRLMTAREAREHARLDLRRFRRQVALQLWADSQGLGPCLPDGGEPADLRQLLAGPAYLDLIRELIH